MIESNTKKHTPTHPVCPICGEDFVSNPGAPGRLICRHCSQSFDKKSILSMWHGTGYSKIVKGNFNYPAASDSSAPMLTGELDPQSIEDSIRAEDDIAYEEDIFAVFEAQDDTFDDLPVYDYTGRNTPLFNGEKDDIEETPRSGPFAILSALIGLVSLIIALIPVVGLVSIIPAMLGMSAGRYSWNTLHPGTTYYAAAIFGTIACGLAVVTAIVAVIFGNQIIDLLNSTFPSLFAK